MKVAGVMVLAVVHSLLVFVIGLELAHASEEAAFDGPPVSASLLTVFYGLMPLLPVAQAIPVTLPASAWLVFSPLNTFLWIVVLFWAIPRLLRGLTLRFRQTLAGTPCE